MPLVELLQIGRSPLLLLNLPLAVLHLVLALLPPTDKAKLPHVCKTSLQTVVQHKRQLIFAASKDGSDRHAGRLLCAQLATRTEALKLELGLTDVCFEVAHEMMDVLLQSAEVAGLGCVDDLEVWLPNLVST